MMGQPSESAGRSAKSSLCSLKQEGGSSQESVLRFRSIIKGWCMNINDIIKDADVDFV